MIKNTTKIVAGMMAVIMLLSSAGCTAEKKTEKFSSSFFDTFDTVVTVYGYAESQEAFDNFLAIIHNRFVELDQMFDAYNDYVGVNNIKTINDNAGKTPIDVKSEIIQLIMRAKELSEQTGGSVNIAMGAVLDLWEKQRLQAAENPDSAALPDSKELGMAAEHIDIDQVIVDSEAGTVYLEDPYMSLDVGAVAKGYACEIVKNELVAAGFDSFVISAGGNVVTVGTEAGTGDAWSIGIQNPDTQTAANIVDTLKVSNLAVVTAGSYQRYFTVNGVRYNHIIDPKTLSSAVNFDSVTVVCADSMIADFMATTLFILPYEQGVELAAQMGVNAFWVDTEGRIRYTDGYPEYSETY